MGGTFDPIHHGHLVAASEAQMSLDLDEVVFVPTGAPADKPDVSDSEHRYLMAVIATASNPRFRVSRVDIDRPGTTYTVDTLMDLSREFPDADLFFITGADAIAGRCGRTTGVAIPALPGSASSDHCPDRCRGAARSRSG